MRRWCAALTLAAILAWGAGFALFAWRALQPPGPAPRGDGIVVLTGGAGRIAAAVALLKADRARLLLISGVEPNLELAGLLRASDVALAPRTDLRSRIVLGHAATSTLGNAVETADWARANRLHRLIVVTAGYHMPRALDDIEAALPNAILLPYRVLPPGLRSRHSLVGSLGVLRLLLSEYDKWLLVASGLTKVAHLREIA